MMQASKQELAMASCQAQLAAATKSRDHLSATLARCKLHCVKHEDPFELAVHQQL